MPNRRKTFFVDSVYGSDDNSGQSEVLAWKTVDRVNCEHAATPLGPGDRILLRAGQTFSGSLIFHNLHGTKDANITIGSYQALNDINSNRPIITPKLDSRTSFRSIYFKNCSNVSVDYIEIKKGNVCVSFNDERLIDCDYSGIAFTRMYFHNIDPSNVSSGALVFSATKYDGHHINNILIDKCVFEGIRCHSVLFSVVDWLSNTECQPSAVFSDVILTNNETSNTTSTAFHLKCVTNSFIANNIILNSGKFFEDTAQLESSGISLVYCDRTIIEGNTISGSHGAKRSTAIVVGPYSRLLLIQKNKSANNFGGFILFLGGSANNCVRHNVSIGDGERVKDGARQFIPGKSVSFSDYAGWDYDFNEPIKSPVKYIYVHNNYFDVSAFVDCSNAVISAFGHCRGVLFSYNTVVSTLPLCIQLSSEASLFSITSNIINREWNINNKAIYHSAIQALCTTNNITIDNVVESNNVDTINLCGKNPNKDTHINSVCNFDEDIVGTFNSNITTNETTQLIQSADVCPHLQLTETKKNKSVLCIICSSSKKINSLMENLTASVNISFMNRDISQQLGVSPQRFMNMFSNSDSILRHNRTLSQIKASSSGSESEAYQSFLDFVFGNIKSQDILLLGENFLTKGEIYIDSLFNKITQHSINLKVLLLVDNVFDEVQHRFINRLEASTLHTCLDINLFTEHLNKTGFVSSENIITRLIGFVEQTNFLAVDFYTNNSTKVAFRDFWKILSNQSVVFSDIFTRLAESECDRHIVSEDVVDPAFFPYILKSLKYEDTATQQQEIKEIKSCQLKYKIKTENCPLLNLCSDSIDACNTHIQRLEQIGSFNFFKKTIFLTNGYTDSMKYVKVNFHEVPQNSNKLKLNNQQVA